MIFYFKANGEPIAVMPDEVYLGSSKATSVYFVCPIPSQHLVNVAFTLPDGTVMPCRLMELVNDNLTDVLDGDNNHYSVWKYDLPVSITSISGQVQIQFFVTLGEDEIVATSASSFFVEKGVANAIPEIDDDATYQQFLNVVSSIISNYETKLDKTRTIAGIDLEDDITKEELLSALDLDNGLDVGALVKNKVSKHDPYTDAVLDINVSAVNGTNNVITFTPALNFTSVDYGDGTVLLSTDTNSHSHTYTEAGDYTIVLYGLTNAMFLNMTSLKKISLPDCIYEITSMAFLNCSNLKEIHLPNNLSTIGDQAFNGCSSLQELILPVNFMSLGQLSLADCTALRTLIIKGEAPCIITSTTFYDCQLSKITVPYGSKQYYTYMSDWNSLFSKIQEEKTDDITASNPSPLTSKGVYNLLTSNATVMTVTFSDDTTAEFRLINKNAVSE